MWIGACLASDAAVAEADDGAVLGGRVLVLVLEAEPQTRAVVGLASPPAAKLHLIAAEVGAALDNLGVTHGARFSSTAAAAAGNGTGKGEVCGSRRQQKLGAPDLRRRAAAGTHVVGGQQGAEARRGLPAGQGRPGAMCSYYISRLYEYYRNNFTCMHACAHEN